MKIRSGFIPNSSASSFVILGMSFDTSELKTLLKIDDVEFENAPWYGDIWNYINQKFKLDVDTTYDGEIYFIGKSLWSSNECVDEDDPKKWPIIDDKLKDDIKIKLKEMGVKNPKLKIYSYACGA